MSETDDTDVLLLIPPDFFLVRSSGSEESLLDSSRTVVHKPVSCTAQVIGKLVTQVHCLENRLESLELTESVSTSTVRSKSWRTDSFENCSFDTKYSTFPRRRRKKPVKRGKRHDQSLTSLDSVSTLRNIPLLQLKDSKLSRSSKDVYDTTSMDGDLSSIVSTPSKKNDRLLLHEIDEFLTKVESYESPETKQKDTEPSLSPENVIKATSDYISQKFDKNDEIKLPSGRTVSSNVLDKYIYLVKNNSQDKTCKGQFDDNSLKQATVSSVKPSTEKFAQERSPSIRRLNFSDTKDVQPTSTPKKPMLPSTSYADTFRPSSNKIYDRASKVLEQYRSQNCSRNSQNVTDPSYMKEDFKLPQMRPFVEKEGIKSLQAKFIDSIDTDLLSLSELWGEKGERMDRGDSGKLEEERLKREHCEAMIQQLQKKVLEQQEKLAVAVKVDRAKDIAIAKLRDAWIKLTSSLDRAEDRHRAALEKMCREVDNFKNVADDAQKKTNHFEAELYKALDLAHDYQEKCKQMAAQKNDIQDSCEKAILAKDEIIMCKDREIQMLKENYETVMRLNKQSTDCVKNLEESLEKEKTDHETTKSKVQDLTNRIESLSDEALLVQQEKELLRDKVSEERARFNVIERQLCEKQNQCSEILRKCDNLESEIKAQRRQLDMQKSELKAHYQRQLEEAVLAKLHEFQEQLDRAERDVEEQARSRETALVDGYGKQLASVEEQHKLEVHLLEEKQKEEIKLYRLQLAQASEKISLLESKLESYRRRRGQIASQLHSVMESQWRQALVILTQGHRASSLDLTRPDSVAAQLQEYPKPPLSLPRAAPDERKLLSFDSLSDNELQQYVKLLLTKPPNLDGSGDTSNRCGDRHEECQLELSHAPDTEEPTSDRPDRDKRDRDRVKRSLNSSKPPWKS